MRIFRLPSAPKQYSEAAENKFRRELEQALQNASNETGGAVQPASVGTSAVKATIAGQAKILDGNSVVVLDTTGVNRIIAVPVQPSANSGTAITIDLSSGLTQQIQLTGTATVTLTNPMNGGRYRIWFQQDATGSRPFPTIVDGSGNATVMYTNDTPPTLTTTPGALDLFEFEYRTTPTTRYTCITLQLNVLLPTPQVQSVTTTAVSVASTTHNVNMPATVTAGDLLIVLIAVSNAVAVDTPTGWTAKTTGSRTGLRVATFVKIASGSEGGGTVDFHTTGTSTTAAACCYRITRWFGDLTGVASGGSSGSSTAPDPPSLTPAWTDRDLWLAVWGHAANPSVLADPPNYTNPTGTNDGAVGCGVYSTRRTLYAATENPGAGSIDASRNWVGVTVAVRPPA